MVFHWSLSDSKSPQVSRTLINILAVLNNAVIWIISTRPPNSKFSKPFNNPLVTAPKAPITIGTIVTFMFHSFFNYLASSMYISFFSNSFSFILWSAGRAKSTILQILFFLLITIRSGLLAEIRWSVCISMSHRNLFGIADIEHSPYYTNFGLPQTLRVKLWQLYTVVIYIYIHKNAAMLRAILNKSWRQHPTRHQLYGHLPHITRTIQVRRTRHAGHCWRSRDEHISDVLLRTTTHGRAKAGRPARTYIQQLCEDTGCCPEDLPEAMNDREKRRERVRDIRATSTTWWWWWWWWWYTHIYIYIYILLYIHEWRVFYISDRLFLDLSLKRVNSTRWQSASGLCDHLAEKLWVRTFEIYLRKHIENFSNI